MATLKQQYPELKTMYSKTLQSVGNHLFNNISVVVSLRNKGFKTGRLRHKNDYRLDLKRIKPVKFLGVVFLTLVRESLPSSLIRYNAHFSRFIPALSFIWWIMSLCSLDVLII